MGLLSSPLALLLAAALAFGGVQTLRLNAEQNSKIAEVARRDAIIAEQTASIGTYKQQAVNQATLVKFANIAAKESGREGQKWKARFAQAETELPALLSTYKNPLQACLGTVEWMRKQWNAKAGDWNNER